MDNFDIATKQMRESMTSAQSTLERAFVVLERVEQSTELHERYALMQQLENSFTAIVNNIELRKQFPEIGEEIGELVKKGHISKLEYEQIKHKCKRIDFERAKQAVTNPNEVDQGE